MDVTTPYEFAWFGDISQTPASSTFDQLLITAQRTTVANPLHKCSSGLLPYAMQ
jgi:hypothetical protein